jgi:hypothetical protein
VVFPFTVDDQSDDAAFGTTQPQPVGGSWPVHSDLVQQAFARSGGLETQITGTTRLLDRSTVRGVDCIEVASTVTGQLQGMDELPRGSTVRTGTFNAHVRSVMPIALEQHALVDAFDVSMQAEIEIPVQGQTAQLQIRLEAEMETNSSPLRP